MARRPTTAFSRAAARTAVLILLLLLVPAGNAWAHGDEGAVPARQDVLQAIAYIVNSPDDMDSVKDKVADALESKDADGVDVALVKQAQAAVDREDMMGARELLQRSIGARADVTGRNVQPILQVPTGSDDAQLATGEETGTTVVTDELPGRGALTRPDVALLVLAVIVGAAGIVLSIRLRPADSIHALRQSAQPAGRA